MTKRWVTVNFTASPGRVTFFNTKYKGMARILQRGEEQGSKSHFSLLSEPISPSSLLLISSSKSIQFNSPYSELFFFSLLPTFPPYFSLLSTLFGPFLPPPYSVPTPSVQGFPRPFVFIITA